MMRLFDALWFRLQSPLRKVSNYLLVNYPTVWEYDFVRKGLVLMICYITTIFLAFIVIPILSYLFPDLRTGSKTLIWIFSLGIPLLTYYYFLMEVNDRRKIKIAIIDYRSVFQTAVGHFSRREEYIVLIVNYIYYALLYCLPLIFFYTANKKIVYNQDHFFNKRLKDYIAGEFYIYKTSNAFLDTINQPEYILNDSLKVDNTNRELKNDSLFAVNINDSLAQNFDSLYFDGASPNSILDFINEIDFSDSLGIFNQYISSLGLVINPMRHQNQNRVLDQFQEFKTPLHQGVRKIRDLSEIDYRKSRQIPLVLLALIAFAFSRSLVIGYFKLNDHYIINPLFRFLYKIILILFISLSVLGITVLGFMLLDEISQVEGFFKQGSSFDITNYSIWVTAIKFYLLLGTIYYFLFFVKFKHRFIVRELKPKNFFYYEKYFLERFKG